MNREQYRELLRAAQQEQLRQQADRVQYARRAAELQQAIEETPRRQYAVIAAVDLQGGFAKDGSLPWTFPQDFKWFKSRTKKHICVMGRLTYEEIVKLRGKKNSKNILPGRKSFVVSNTLTELPNATVVKSIREVELRLADEDEGKTIFIIGGSRLFNEGVTLANVAYITAINEVYSCDKFFPTDYLLEHFYSDKVYEHANSPELRFTIWKRKR